MVPRVLLMGSPKESLGLSLRLFKVLRKVELEDSLSAASRDLQDLSPSQPQAFSMQPPKLLKVSRIPPNSSITKLRNLKEKDLQEFFMDSTENSDFMTKNCQCVQKLLPS